MIDADVPVTPEAVARHYDELDPFYRELWGQHLHHGLFRDGAMSANEAVCRLVHLVAQRVAIRPDDHVCDVGCGYGAPAAILAEQYGAQVTGFTVSRRQYEVAQARADARCRFVLGDWLESGLPSGAFDVVLALESTEHMADKARFFREAHRILKPGGRLVVCAWTVNHGAPAWQLDRLVRPICSEGRLPGMGSGGEYRGWAERAGFASVATDDLTQDVQRTWVVGAARVTRRLVRPSTWRYLLDRRQSNRRFVFTVLRMVLAYRLGCLRYLMLSASRPVVSSAGRRSTPVPARSR